MKNGKRKTNKQKDTYTLVGQNIIFKEMSWNRVTVKRRTNKRTRIFGLQQCLTPVYRTHKINKSLTHVNIKISTTIVNVQQWLIPCQWHRTSHHRWIDEICKDIINQTLQHKVFKYLSALKLRETRKTLREMKMKSKGGSILNMEADLLRASCSNFPAWNVEGNPGLSSQSRPS